MNMREAVVWAYRFTLNREPENDATIDALAHIADPLQLRRTMCGSAEFAEMIEKAMHPFRTASAIDWRAGATWAFRLLMAREATPEEVDTLAATQSVNEMRLLVLLSRECEARWPELKPLADFSIVNAFAPFPARLPIADAFQDILGSITRVGYLDTNWHGLSGYAYRSVPRTGEAGLHGTSEWIGTLRSVIEAGDTFSAIELGAGWAPWLVVSHRAAARRGIDRIELTGVEGSEEHHAFMIDNFDVNGIEPGSHALHHAVVGAEDGIARFPKLHVATDDYGANAVFGESERHTMEQRGDLEEVRSISINTLLSGKERVDLIHIDIQGHEEVVIRAGLDALNAKVRRMVIGTHSRAIEGNLLDLLQGEGWICESEVPCILKREADGLLKLATDGEQVWRNTKVPSLQ